MIPPREAEFLSYLQGCGPVGTWVTPNPLHIRIDLNIGSRAWMHNIRVYLLQRGLIETQPVEGSCGFAYRVLVRVEHLEIGCKKRGRKVGSTNGWRNCNSLVPYAGREVVNAW